MTGFPLAASLPEELRCLLQALSHTLLTRVIAFSQRSTVDNAMNWDRGIAVERDQPLAATGQETFEFVGC
jgi:hypothetical protein